MKALYDQNLPRRLVGELASLFPDSAHVGALGLDTATEHAHSAARLGLPVRVPTAVLVEAYCGTSADAAVDRLFQSGVRPIAMGQGMARLAGALQRRDRLDSCHTVDALVVATAARLGGGIVATGDPDDLRSLARQHPMSESSQYRPDAEL